YKSPLRLIRLFNPPISLKPLFSNKRYPSIVVRDSNALMLLRDVQFEISKDPSIDCKLFKPEKLVTEFIRIFVSLPTFVRLFKPVKLFKVLLVIVNLP